MFSGLDMEGSNSNLRFLENQPEDLVSSFREFIDLHPPNLGHEEIGRVLPVDRPERPRSRHQPLAKTQVCSHG